MTVVTGVLVTTLPGAAPRVATRLLAVPGLELEGGDGDARLAAVCTAESGEALERLVERLVAEDEEILGIYPTFVGQD